MKFWQWLATRAASFWILGIALTSMGGLGIYIQQLRVDAAFCTGKRSAQPAIDRLTDRIIDRIEKDTQEKLDAIEQVQDECAGTDASADVLDVLRDG